MAKLWQINDVHPLKLSEAGPVDVADGLLVVPMDASPRGQLEHKVPDPLAAVLPMRDGKALLQVLTQRGAVQAKRTPTSAGRAKPEGIVYAPTQNGPRGVRQPVGPTQGGDVWDAFLVLPEPKRQIDRPIDVDRHYWQGFIDEEFRHGRGSAHPGKHWAIAWSIYCRYIAPGSSHCNKPSAWYLTGEGQ